MKFRTKNELFIDAINWLIDEGYAMNQGDVAAKAGIGPNVISRIKKGFVKEVSEDTIRALVNHFDMLNLDYLRGKSEHISRSEHLKHSFESELSKTPRPQIDQSSLLNTALAAQMETIENLKQTISDMKEHHQREISNIIEQNQRELAAKDAHIADLTKLADDRLHRISELRSIIDAQNMPSSYPFPIGAADHHIQKIFSSK